MDPLSWVDRVVPALGSTFVDLTGLVERPNSPQLRMLAESPMLSLVLLVPAVALRFVGYAAAKVRAEGSVDVWLFALMLAIPSVLIILLPDLVFGGRRSTAIRYATPLLVSFELVVGRFLAGRLADRHGRAATSWRAATAQTRSGVSRAKPLTGWRSAGAICATRCSIS